MRRDAYGVEKIHGLVFVDGEEAPLTRRCGLRKEMLVSRLDARRKVRKGAHSGERTCFL